MCEIQGLSASDISTFPYNQQVAYFIRKLILIRFVNNLTVILSISKPERAWTFDHVKHETSNVTDRFHECSMFVYDGFTTVS
jgi:hypothetical protein